MVDASAVTITQAKHILLSLTTDENWAKQMAQIDLQSPSTMDISPTLTEISPASVADTITDSPSFPTTMPSPNTMWNTSVPPPPVPLIQYTATSPAPDGAITATLPIGSVDQSGCAPTQALVHGVLWDKEAHQHSALHGIAFQ